MFPEVLAELEPVCLALVEIFLDTKVLTVLQVAAAEVVFVAVASRLVVAISRLAVMEVQPHSAAQVHRVQVSRKQGVRAIVSVMRSVVPVVVPPASAAMATDTVVPKRSLGLLLLPRPVHQHQLKAEATHTLIEHINDV